MEGMLIVISGPSGVGKGTIYNSVLERMPKVKTSISVTTRSPRRTETDGVEYFFRTKEQFIEMIKNDELLEYAEVFGNYYGTPKQHVFDVVNSGETIMLEIDVEGAKQIKSKFPSCVTVFIMPPSLEVLKERLIGRATDNEDVIKRRLSEATREISEYKLFDYCIFNDDLNNAIDDAVSIIRSERNRIVRNENKIKELIRR